jgi:hypothetical protein
VIDEPTDKNATQFLEQFNNDLQVSTPDEKQAGDEPKADADGKYECPICHKKYSRRWYIKGGHMRMHRKFHRNQLTPFFSVQIKPFSCARCSKTFNDRSNCRAHERICDRKYARNQ